MENQHAKSQQPQKAPATAKRRYSLRRKLLLFMVTLMIALIACEGAVRMRAWLRYGVTGTGVADGALMVDQELQQNVPRPGYTNKASKVSLSINSLGFRGEEFAKKKPPGAVRIACVGGSTTFCGEASDEGAWPAQLQKLLQAKYPDVSIEVINAGVPGYRITESRRSLDRRVLPLKPDLVIYYEAQNDIAIDTRALARREGLIAQDDEYQSSFVKSLSSYSMLFDLVHKNAKILFAARDSSAGRLDSVPDDLPKRFIGELAEMSDSLAARKIPLVLSSFIVKYRRDQSRETQIANADVAFYYTPWITIDGLFDAIETYNAAIAELSRAKKIPFVDDRDAVTPDAKHFADFIHFTDAGCTQMAERFFRFFDTSNILNPIVDRAKAAGSAKAAAQN
jgi:lysophospholipase L1-like esterase